MSAIRRRVRVIEIAAKIAYCRRWDGDLSCLACNLGFLSLTMRRMLCVGRNPRDEPHRDAGAAALQAAGGDRLAAP